MPKKAKKKIRIGKLPRGQLITLCKGRGIALGQANKRIDALVKHADELLTRVDDLRAARIQEQEEIERLRGIASGHEDECVKYHTQLNTATDTIANQDTLIDELNRQINEYKSIVSTQQDRIDKLTEDVDDFRSLWHNANAKEKRHDAHWRALSDFAYQSIGHIQRTLDLITSGLSNLNSKYEEE